MSVKFTSKKRKIAITAIILACILAIVAIVTTSVLLSGRNVPIVDTPTGNDPTITDPVIPPDDGDKEDPKPSVQIAGLPVEGEIIKNYDENKLVYSVTLNEWSAHTAVDIKAERGTEVKAILDGVVEQVGSDSLFGTYVIIKHSENRVSIYKSLDTELSVKVGDNVSKGTVIGRVGDTMKNEKKDGPHLHLETKVNDKFVNPAEIIPDLGNK